MVQRSAYSRRPVFTAFVLTATLIGVMMTFATVLSGCSCDDTEIPNECY